MKTNQAIKKYSLEKCLEAYELHKQGNGASTIGFYLGLKTNQADCAINAGRELYQNNSGIKSPNPKWI